MKIQRDEEERIFVEQEQARRQAAREERRRRREAKANEFHGVPPEIIAGYKVFEFKAPSKPMSAPSRRGYVKENLNLGNFLHSMT
jgi:hypothetical protein